MKKIVVFPHVEAIPIEAVEYLTKGIGSPEVAERCDRWAQHFELGRIDPDNYGQFRDTEPYIDGLGIDCVYCEVLLKN